MVKFRRCDIMKLFSKIFFVLAVCVFSSKELLNEALANEYILADEETEEFIQEIVDKVKDALKCDRQIPVFISSSKILNACATQNGSIVINVGAILDCADVSEFIAIVAHEVGHVAGNHITTFLANQSDFMRGGLVTMLLGATISVLAQDPAPLAAGFLGGQSMSQKMALSKLRQKENMADSRSAEAVQKLGWPIFKGFVSVHKKLASGVPLYNVYESTHPASQDRISKFRDLYEKEKSKTPDEEKVEYVNRLQKRFEIIQTKIKSLILDPVYIKEFYASPKDDKEKYAKAIAFYRNNDFESAIKLLDTIKDDAIDDAHLAEIKAMSLINLKKSGEAAEVAEKYLGGKKRHRDLGVIYADAIVTGNLKKAKIQNGIKILKKLKIKCQNNLSIIDMLGRLYYLNGEQDKASLCTTEVSLQIGDLEKAQIHAQKAKNSKDKFVKRSAEDILQILKEPRE